MGPIQASLLRRSGMTVTDHEDSSTAMRHALGYGLPSLTLLYAPPLQPLSLSRIDVFVLQLRFAPMAQPQEPGPLVTSGRFQPPHQSL
jgi:hypothetical protein